MVLVGRRHVPAQVDAGDDDAVVGVVGGRHGKQADVHLRVGAQDLRDREGSAGEHRRLAAREGGAGVLVAVGHRAVLGVVEELEELLGRLAVVVGERGLAGVDLADVV